jgi:hypothetical protein
MFTKLQGKKRKQGHGNAANQKVCIALRGKT